ncbi:MAG: DUF2271 domain-containing protein [Bacteroidetes bacterium]|nr:DUF2271 domain-containing protein [Bacteroidota bacterium]
MKKLLFTVVFIILIIIGLSDNVKAQTNGTLTFTYTQTAPTSSATKNVMAVWIESSTGSFIKTKMRYWGSSTTDHLPSWKAKSAQNLTDANTGATRTASTSPTAFGAKTITWDGTNTSGVLVPDGVYNVFVESSYCTPEPAANQHWIITNFSFTKGANADHQTPTGPTNFSGITLDWVPSTTSVENITDNSEINIFPNPSIDGIIKIQYKDASAIKVENSIGEIVYDEQLSEPSKGIKTIDLSKLANGVYFVILQSKDKKIKSKLLLNK